MEEIEKQTLDKIIIQGMYFETPSENVTGVNICDYDSNDERKRGEAWNRYNNPYNNPGIRLGVIGDFSADESVVGPATLKARVAFAVNARAKTAINEKKGKIRSSALARRAPVQDNRMFQRKTLPGKKSFFVLIGIDVSFSMAGEKIARAKRLAMIEAEVLSRIGVEFEIWAHSAGYNSDSIL